MSEIERGNLVDDIVNGWQGQVVMKEADPKVGDVFF
jgi:hypothetical protein